MHRKLTSLFLASAVLATVALTATTAFAETTTVKVPFSFTVNGKICPAGTYAVQRNENMRTLKLSSIDSSKSFSFIATSADRSPEGNQVVLKFDQDGEMKTLSSVQSGTLATPRLDKKSRKNNVAPAETVVAN
jgi:hypothetical protein